VIRSPNGDVTLRNPPTVQADQLTEKFEVVLLSCKAFDLDDAIKSFAPAVGPQTSISRCSTACGISACWTTNSAATGWMHRRPLRDRGQLNDSASGAPADAVPVAAEFVVQHAEMPHAVEQRMIEVCGPTAGANDLMASSRSKALQLSRRPRISR